jgi:hypothetical protein
MDLNLKKIVWRKKIFVVTSSVFVNNLTCVTYSAAYVTAPACLASLFLKLSTRTAARLHTTFRPVANYYKQHFLDALQIQGYSK